MSLEYARELHARNKRFGPPSRLPSRPITTTSYQDIPTSSGFSVPFDDSTLEPIHDKCCHLGEPLPFRLNNPSVLFPQQTKPRTWTGLLGRSSGLGERMYIALRVFVSPRRQRFRARCTERPPTTDSGTPRSPAPLLFRSDGQVRGALVFMTRKCLSFLLFFLRCEILRKRVVGNAGKSGRTLNSRDWECRVVRGLPIRRCVWRLVTVDALPWAPVRHNPFLPYGRRVTEQVRLIPTYSHP